ncbi:MAG: hypothetical protein FJ312_09845 [SAR202 cluster bacterium]|nr:hypothetical protein [SAR202 cluster bacterium]
MTTPLSQMPKPDAGQYGQARKLLLVPTFYTAPEVPEELVALLARYWSEVRDHFASMERSLGQVRHVYHESVYADGDEGMGIVEMANPHGSGFITTLCRSTAKLEVAEDRETFYEGGDWQRAIAVGLMSEKVQRLAYEGYDDVLRRRYEHIGQAIDKTLQPGELGALFIVEHHRVQFPVDVQVFFVAPPSLNEIKRWIRDELQTTLEDMRQEQGPSAGAGRPT